MRFSFQSVFSLLTVLIMGFTPALASDVSSEGTEALGKLPVQDAGRVKPYETFARESLQLLYGSQKYKSPNAEKRPAREIVMTWMLVPQYWETQKIIEVPHKGLRDALNLPAKEKHFSPAELMGNDRLPLAMQELAAFRETKKKLTPYFQAVQRLESQLGMFQIIRSGEGLRVAPPAAGTERAKASPTGEPEKWLAVSELEGEMQERFSTLLRSFIQALPQNADSESAPKSSPGEPAYPLEKAVDEFIAAARALNPDLYPTDRLIATEVHYKKLHPFLITWILYLISAILMAFAWQSGKGVYYKLGWVAAGLAFLMHSYGFGLRMYITGRPPVSNMYETVVWVSWGAIVFAAVFEYLWRRYFILLAGAAVGVLCLIVADMAPTILDRSLQPLEPVLRSNLWLTVHVLVITLSYSAFFLAWALGNLGLGFVLKGENPSSERIRILVQSLYRSVQVGVVLLAAGTILGGIWADYSWGRFWGWDPKETWALIALLGYLAMLHGRLVGLLKNFGMMVSAIVAFNLVIMAWYGVNYVLGAGLHSYGFGAGGVEYVGAFVFINLVYAGFVGYVLNARASSVSGENQKTAAS